MPHYDVAIIGGGPAGSTTGVLLKKYAPDLKVAIFERESFPRDHVGESQLPGASKVLHEMGCWDAVEAAGFPVKVGATYLWGKSPELWDFHFAPPERLKEITRPGQFKGVRTSTAFQVDRAIYDKILLDRARELRCEVHEATRVVQVTTVGDRVTGLQVDGIGGVTADTYVDASGHSGILRRAVGVPVTYPSSLQNVAIWEYWRNAQWATTVGQGGTYVQVLSVGFGWVWFIPLGPDRTSVGLVVPVEYLKGSGQSLPQLYERALSDLPRVQELMRDAVPEGKTQTTKDWSFLAERHTGENWFLVGESGGFADPILAAGLSITHKAAREAAYTILDMRNGADEKWLRESYEQIQNRRIGNHIRFADYWYSVNAQFEDLQAFTAQIAKDNGLDLSPEKAWAWLAQGGFIDDSFAPSTGTFSLGNLKQFGDFLGETPTDYAPTKNNVFLPKLEGAKRDIRSQYADGKVIRVDCFSRGASKVWPLVGPGQFWHRVLQADPTVQEIKIELVCEEERLRAPRGSYQFQLMLFLEALIDDGWIAASYDPAQPLIGAIAFGQALAKNAPF